MWLGLFTFSCPLCQSRPWGRTKLTHSNDKSKKTELEITVAIIHEKFFFFVGTSVLFVCLMVVLWNCSEFPSGDTRYDLNVVNSNHFTSLFVSRVFGPNIPYL